MTCLEPVEPGRRHMPRPSWAWAVAAGLVVLAGCASPSHRAPVEERNPAPVRPDAANPAAPASAAEATVVKPAPPGIENAGKPGYYTVKQGDTLLRVALENGQNWRDLARWNNLANPNVLEVGQVVRVVPPEPNANGVVVRPVLPSGAYESRAAVGQSSAPSAAASGVVAAAAPPAGAGSDAAGTAAADSDENLRWVWPSEGPLLAPFDETKTKGLEIGGKAGDPVLAAADGRVVYAGAGLRGYGNLVIVKHNATFLSAYAHNQTLLVKEDEIVRRGQKIAEMGSSDADKVELHFEIRRQGKPIDPMRLLPPR